MKHLLILLLSLSFSLHSIGQVDSAEARYVRLTNNFKGRASAYDTMAVYFNKWRVNFTFDLGGGIDNGIFTSYANSPGFYGIQNPSYSISFSPAYGFSSFYGITEKSAVGIGMFYEQVKFTPQSSLTQLNPGSASEFAVAAGYLHCLRSWRYFYYGFEIGVMSLKTNFDTNTYSNKPKNLPSSIQPIFAEFIGFRYPIEQSLWLHIEACTWGIMSGGSGTVATESIGLDYAIDSRPLCHKPVGQDPYYRPEKVYKRAMKDSAIRHSDKYKALHDSTSNYYNYGKLHFSLESGNADLPGITFLYLGTVTSNYVEHDLPSFGFSAQYGFDVKANLGVSVLFQQVDYDKISTASSYYSSGNVTYLFLSARYTHTIFGSRSFYYGAEAGIYSFGLNYNKANTFSNQPQVPYALTSGLCAGPLLGVKINITRNIGIHAEFVPDYPFLYADYGITYTINSPLKHSHLDMFR